MRSTSAPRIEIVRLDGARVYEVRLAGRAQSYVDLDDPTSLGFDYLRWMADVVDVAAPEGTRLRVLHVGGGGLSLARYVAATRPTSAQVVLEPDVELVAAVRRDLPLAPRSGIKVREVDGRSGLGSLRDGFADVVLVDAFHDGEVPADLIDSAGLAELVRVLAEGGLMALNLVDRAPFASVRPLLGELAAGLGGYAVCAEPATLRGRRSGNLVVVTGRRAVPIGELRRRASVSAVPYRVLDTFAGVGSATTTEPG